MIPLEYSNECLSREMNLFTLEDLNFTLDLTENTDINEENIKNEEVLILNQCTEPALSGAGTCRHSTLESCPDV